MPTPKYFDVEIEIKLTPVRDSSLSDGKDKSIKEGKTKTLNFKRRFPK